VTPVLAAGLGLGRTEGAVLADVSPGSPADRGGLSVGDLVLTLDGKPIENGRQLQVNLYRRAVGDVVRLEVLRGQERVTAVVKVAERFDPLATAAALTDPRENLVPRLGILGVTLDPKIAELLPLRGRAGVVVTSATSGALDSENGGLVPGDVIHAVNGQWVTDLPAPHSGRRGEGRGCRGASGGTSGPVDVPGVHGGIKRCVPAIQNSECRYWRPRFVLPAFCILQ
jgi:serine protease Do